MGLDFYESAHAALFFGRVQEVRLLTANAIASPFTVVYGPSGVGKSSLLNAGLVASCIRAGTEVVAGREWHPSALPRFLTAVAEPIAQPLRVVVMDQFEEYFLYDHDDHALMEWLAAAIQQSNPQTHVVIGIRDDTLSLMDRLSDVVPDVLSNLLRIEHLTSEEAIAALSLSVDAFNRLYPDQSVSLLPGVLRTVVESTISASHVARSLAVPRSQPSAKEIQLPYVQLVLDRLWEVEAAKDSRELRSATLTTLGGPANVVLNHVNNVMNSMSAHHQQVAHDILRFLISPGGTKLALTPQDVGEFANVDVADAGEVMQELSASKARLLRPLRGQDSDVLYYELFHDFLVAPVRAWRHAFEAQRVSDWKRDFQKRWLVPIIAVGLIVSTALALWAFIQSKEADRNAAVASMQAKLAEEESAAARIARGDAETARAEADAARSHIEAAFAFRQQLYSADSKTLAQLLTTIARDDQIDFSVRGALRDWQCEGGVPAFRFTLEPEHPDAVKSMVAVITYYFNHPTFLSPSMTASALNDFRVEWNGCGTIDTIYAILELRDPSSTNPFEYSVINMAAELEESDGYPEEK